MAKRWTYRKYNANTWPGHLNEDQLDTSRKSLSDEDMAGLRDALAQQESSMSSRDKMIKGVRQSGQPGAYSQDDAEVDSTPWMPELYDESAQDTDPFKDK